jgi:long-chain acyl-CoA synthetase
LPVDDEEVMTSFATVSVAAILKESAERTPDAIAIRCGSEALSYERLWDEARACAGALRARGIGPGDAVALLCPNVPDFVRVYYAVLSLGAVVVPIHALLKAGEIAYMLRDADVRLLVCAEPLRAEGEAGAREAGVPMVTVLSPASSDAIRLEDHVADPIESYVPRAPDDIATVLYTSGTTGTPKGALGSHLALVEQTNVILLNTFGIRADDIVFGGLPLFHTFGQTVAMNAGLRAGAEVVLLPKFDGETALRTLVETGCTVMMGVPTMYIALLEAARTIPDRPPLRMAISGGASLPGAVLERFREVFGVEVSEGYGLTETSPVATFNHIGRPPRVGSVGTPIWGVDVEIADAELDDEIRLLPHGELGELVVRGHNLMSGYLNRPEDTAAAIVDGWFRTGDLGRKDDDDYLWIVDRKKDLIIRNGYNVYPREVEEVLATHPRVASAAVFGLPHEVRGQEIAACVVLTPGDPLDGGELVDFVKERIAPYKYPRRVEIVDALPLGPSGKVLKRELAARYAA